MQKIKLLPLILGLLLSFVTTRVMSAPLNESDNDFDDPNVNKSKNTGSGPYLARIISPKAIVYADENMNSPLGYIGNGKLISVGNPRRLNRELVPIVVYGRVAYIEIKNLRYENSSIEEQNSARGAPREHNFDIILEKPEEKLSENNSFYFDLHSFNGGEDTKNAFQSITGESKENYFGFGAQFIHRQFPTRFFWGVTFDYNTISNSQMKFSYSLLGPTFGYTPIKNSLFLVDLYASFDISIGTELIITTNDEKEPTPIVWGPSANARLVLFPNSKYHLTAGGGLKYTNVNKITTLKDANANEVSGIKKIIGVNLFLGFGLEFY